MNKYNLKAKNVRLRITAIVLIIFCLIASFLPGADGDGDITDKLVLVSLGMDFDGTAITVSATSILPDSSGSEGNTVKSVPISAKGKSVAECITKMEQMTGKSVELGLCGVVILGDQIAKEGVSTVTAELLSSSIVGPGAYLVQAYESTAEDIIRKSTMLVDNSVTILTQLIKDAEKNTGVATVTLLDFVSSCFGKSRSSHAPVISIKEADELSGSGGNSEGGDSKKFECESITQTAVYKKGRLSGILSEDAATGFSYTSKDAAKGILVKEHFDVEGIDIGTVSGMVGGRKYGIKTYFKDGKPCAEIEVGVVIKTADRERINALVIEKGYTADRVKDFYEKNFSEEVEKKVRMAYSESLEKEVDIFEIEQNLYRHHVKEYNQYIKSGGDVLKDLKVAIAGKAEMQ